MPVDNDYALALGRAVHAFARLEWSVVWIIERLQPGYIFVQKRATAGIIKNDLKGSIDSNSYLGSYPQLHTDLMTIWNDFKKLVEIRNNLIHGKPCTHNGHQCLSYKDGNYVIWEIAGINKFIEQIFDGNRRTSSVFHGPLSLPPFYNP